MVQTSACPQRQQLEDYLLGRVHDTEAAQLETHLSHCAACISTIHELNPCDEFVDTMRASQTVADTFAQEVDPSLVAQLCRLRSPANPDDEVTTEGTPYPAGKSLSKSSISGPHPTEITEEDIDFLSPPKASDEIGRLGGYRILKVLGAGGMGIVFHAEDAELQRPVALKVMRPRVAEKLTARKRFLREARAAAKIKNDHVVTIHQVGEDNKVPFLAMEFLEGTPLDAWLKRGVKPNVAQILHLGREIAIGLSAAHRQGMIHRDIKPSNIWIEPEHGGRVKILDFGLARVADESVQLTESGMIVGTPAYMAPEQARGEKVDYRCDLFSLGCVLYRLCTGKPAFQGDTTMAILTALAMDHPQPVRELNPDIPEELSDLVMQLLAKDPSQRPESAKKVAKILGTIERERPAGESAKVFEAQSAPSAAASKETIAFIENNDKAEQEIADGDKGPILPSSLQKLDEQPAARAYFRNLAAFAATVIVVLLIPFAIYWAFQSAQITVETPDGTFIVKINDKEVETRLKDGEVHLYNKEGKLMYRLSPSERNKKVKPGEYTIKVVGTDGLQLDTYEFTMAKNGQVTVLVRLEAPARPPITRSQTNYALHFDGKDNYVEVPKTAFQVNDMAGLTVEGYAIPEPTDNVLSGVFSVGYHLQVMLERTTSGKFRWRAEGRDGDGMPDPYVKTSPGSPIGKRAHIAAVLKGDTLKLFVDGRLVGTADAPSGLAKNIYGLLIGKLLTKDLFYHGIIDEVRISKVARYTKDFTPDQRFEPDKDTIALYFFDEGEGNMLVDSSGNRHHGKIVGATWVKEVGPGEFAPVTLPANFALKFDGKDDHVLVPSLQLNEKGPYMIEAWVVLDSNDGGQELISVWGSAGHIRISASAGKWWAQYYHLDSDLLHGTKPVRITNGKQRFHIAAVLGGSLYIDGKVAASTGVGLVGFRSKGLLDFGSKKGAGTDIGSWDGKSSFFKGTIDEIRISKVNRYHSTPANRFEPDNDTLALYHFDEGEGDKLVDSSGNGHHGKIVGATWVKEVATGKFAPFDADRRICKRLRSLGYQVSIVKEYQIKEEMPSLYSHVRGHAVFLDFASNSMPNSNLPLPQKHRFYVVEIGVKLNTALQDGPRMTAADIQELKDLKHLQWLSITPVDKEAFAAIGELAPLEHLFATVPAGVDLGPLEKLKNLKTLVLDGAINEDSLGVIQKLPILRTLALFNAPNVTDDALQHLLNSKLETVMISDTSITGRGVESLKDLKTLRTIELARPTGVSYLKQIDGLSLTDSNAVTEEQLKQIAELPKLRMLKANFPEEQKTKFAALRPDVWLALRYDIVPWVKGCGGVLKAFPVAEKEIPIEKIAELKPVPVEKIADLEAGSNQFYLSVKLHNPKIPAETIARALYGWHGLGWIELDLSGTQTDDLFWGLNGYTARRVSRLILKDTAVTDKTLERLSLQGQAYYLRELDVRGTKVTQKGVETFKARRPECKVLSDFDNK